MSVTEALIISNFAQGRHVVIHAAYYAKLNCCEAKHGCEATEECATKQAGLTTNLALYQTGIEAYPLD